MEGGGEWGRSWRYRQKVPVLTSNVTNFFKLKAEKAKNLSGNIFHSVTSGYQITLFIVQEI